MHVLECHAMGVPLGDARCTERHMPLGRIARLDWGHNKVLERMIMYEKRIESSLHRTMNELTRHQMIRRVESEDEQTEPAKGGAPNEAVIKTFDSSALEGPIRDDRIRLREQQTREYWDRVMKREMEAEQQAELKKQGQYAGHQPGIYTLDTRTMNIEKQNDLEKQSQFRKAETNGKTFPNKELRTLFCIQPPVKQTQSEPISRHNPMIRSGSNTYESAGYSPQGSSYFSCAGRRWMLKCTVIGVDGMYLLEQNA